MEKGKSIPKDNDFVIVSRLTAPVSPTTTLSTATYYTFFLPIPFDVFAFLKLCFSMLFYYWASRGPIT
jgi:hypothetical protein